MSSKFASGTVALLGLAGITGAALAQDVQRVEITGSSIKRIASEGALPLEVITQDQMKARGIESIEGLLRQLGANAFGADNAVSSNSVFSTEGDRLGGGGAYANLRGLGPTGTLVLLNGRRLSNQGLSGNSVDLNVIPFEMIQRVEVLKDGASAIYGTDAIGGVINFIMRDDYQGGSISASVSRPTAAGGGTRRRVALSGGYGSLVDQGFNVMGGVSYSQDDILRGKDRAFASGYQPGLFAVPDTTSSPYFANMIGAANTALPTTGTTVTGGGSTRYTVINGLALTNQCDAVPFGVSQVANPTIIPGLGYTVANSTYRCGTDYGRQFMLAVPTKNLSAVLRGSLAINPGTTAFVEYVGSRVETRSEFVPFQFSTTSAPTSINAATNPALAAAFTAMGLPVGFSNGGTALANYPVSGPYYRNMQALYGAAQFDPTKPIAYRLRMNDWGYRTLGNVSTNQRLTLGINGEFAGYDYKASLSHGLADGHTTLIDGYADTNKLVALLASGKYNPFLMPGQSQTAEAMSLVEATKVHGRIQSGSTQIDELNGAVSGKAMQLPAGDLNFAVGINARRESYDFSGTTDFNCVSSFTAANAAFSNSVMGCPGNSPAPNSKRDIGAVYGELIVPVLKTLEMQLAVRTDHYSHIGTTTNPKVAFKFTPLSSLLFRGSYSTGFRAPTPQQLALGRLEQASSATASFADPLKCPNPVGNSDPSCQLTSITVYTGGNPNLKPETSKQASLGVVVSPVESLQASVDYWQIKLADRIHNLTYSQEVQNYGYFANNFNRDANGNLLSIQAGWINAGNTETKGIDFMLQHRAVLGEGVLTTVATATRMLSYKEQLLPSAPMTQYVDKWTTNTLYLKWKANVAPTYKAGNWSTTLAVNYQSGYEDEDRTPYVSTNPAGTPVIRRIASQTTFNLVTNYSGIKNLTLSAGIINVANRKPPFTWHDPDFALGAGWDARTSDPRGRTLQVSGKYNF